MGCLKAKYTSIGEFPEEYQSILWSIDSKDTVIAQLMKFQEMHRKKKQEDPKYTAMFDWSLDISRIAAESAGMMRRLPKEIRQQYVMYRTIVDLLEKAGEHMMNREFDKAKECWAAVEKLRCCGEDECCE